MSDINSALDNLMGCSKEESGKPTLEGSVFVENTFVVESSARYPTMIIRAQGFDTGIGITVYWNSNGDVDEKGIVSEKISLENVIEWPESSNRWVSIETVRTWEHPGDCCEVLSFRVLNGPESMTFYYIVSRDGVFTELFHSEWEDVQSLEGAIQTVSDNVIELTVPNGTWLPIIAPTSEISANMEDTRLSFDMTVKMYVVDGAILLRSSSRTGTHVLVLSPNEYNDGRDYELEVVWGFNQGGAYYVQVGVDNGMMPSAGDGGQPGDDWECCTVVYKVTGDVIEYVGGECWVDAEQSREICPDETKGWTFG